MRELEYIVHGRAGDIGPCNIIDKWQGRFTYDSIILLPCGCETYAGDLRISQDNNWPDVIYPEDDFPFRLVCVCGTIIFRGASARRIQDGPGWAFMFV